MVKKKLVAWVPAIAALVLTARLPVRGQTVDCVAAVVNGQAITIVDLGIARRFGLRPRIGADAPRSAVLEEIIGQKLVLSLAREHTPMAAAEVDAAMKELSLRVGPEGMTAGLAEFGLDEADLRPYVEDTLLYGKIIDVRFGQTTPVTLGEIEAYYRDVYTPAEKAAGREPEPLVRVLGVVEGRLREQKKIEGVEAWTKSLKAQADIRINKDCQ
jgi:hypothetical protein